MSDLIEQHFLDFTGFLGHHIMAQTYNLYNWDTSKLFMNANILTDLAIKISVWLT